MDFVEPCGQGHFTYKPLLVGPFRVFAQMREAALDLREDPGASPGGRGHVDRLSIPLGPLEIPSPKPCGGLSDLFERIDKTSAREGAAVFIFTTKSRPDLKRLSNSSLCRGSRGGRDSVPWPSGCTLAQSLGTECLQCPDTGGNGYAP